MAGSEADLRAIFCEALDKDAPQERASYLDQTCQGRPDLRARVEALLRANVQASSFLAEPSARHVVTVDEPITERPGTVIGPYKLLEQIGEGGFGVVFMAEQQQPIRRKVALKVIKPGMDTRQVIARFEAERQALALMDHPNIAKVLDAGSTGSEPRMEVTGSAEQPLTNVRGSDRPYFVMELVRGLAITDYCDHNSLPVRDRLELFLHVCQAVQHAHHKGIIHRDIKPTNVLVTLHDGVPVPKIIDFGIAKALGQQLTDKTLFTNFAQLIGTPLYMSPEQAELSGLDVDTRSDIYSLGVLLYELLTGTTPFDKERLKTAGYDEIRRIIREEEPPKPSTRISALTRPREPSGASPARLTGTTADQAVTSLATIAAQRKSDPKRLSQLFRGELDWIVMKCLEKDRNRRYETPGALAQDIERYLHDEPVQACPPSTWYRVRKVTRRYRQALVLLSVVGLFLFAAVGLLIVSNVRISHKQQEVDRANADLVIANNNLETNLYFHQVSLAERELATNHGARAEELLDQCKTDLRDWEWHYLKRRIHEEPLVLTGHTYGVSGVAFSANGQVLASASWDGTVRIWEPTTGKFIRALSGKPPGFAGVAISANGQFLAAANWDGTVTVWDLVANQERVLKGQANRANAVAFSPDSRFLAWTGTDRTATIWDLIEDQRKMVLSDHNDDVKAVAFNPAGTRLATGSDDRTVRIWDARTGQLMLPPLAGHQGAVFGVAFSPDGQLLASAGKDRTVRVWDAATGAPIWVLRGHTGYIPAVAFSPDGRRLASGGEDATIRLWDPATGREVITLRDHKGCVNSLAFGPDGWRLASAAYGNLDNTVRIWNATPIEDAGPDPIRIFTGHTQDVQCLAFSPDGSLLASGGPDRTVRVRNADMGQVIHVLRDRQLQEINSVAFSPDGQHLAATSEIGIVAVWNVRSGQKAWGGIRKISDYDLGGIIYSPDGKSLAIADGGKAVHILDATTGENRKTLKGNIGAVSAVAYRSDGRRLAAVSATQQVLVWDTKTWRFQILKGHETSLNSVDYRPDGQFLASAGDDGEVVLWEATGDQEVKLARRFRAHHDGMDCVAFSPDGRRLATCSWDGTVKIWDSTTGRLLRLIRANQGQVRALAFHPDGHTLASAGADGSVKIWEVLP
jgi:WD40 repeat protein/serine/threonine protein kinase